ncbi:MAG: hypothetical protein JWQ41_3512 [Variovorax sp.]|nr:hypothetical protein [Variovorax sp.]
MALAGLGVDKAAKAAGNAADLRLQLKGMKNEQMVTESMEMKMDDEANSQMKKNAGDAMKARLEGASKLAGAFNF